MSTFISILRGINVSGHRKVPMAALKTMYESLGFREVKSYIQSGNVVFQHKGAKDLAGKIEAAIQETFGFEVPVIIRTGAEMNRVLTHNPFLKEPDIETDKLHVTFLAEAPDDALIDKLDTDKYLPDRCLISGQEVYLYCPGGYGNTKLSNAFFEQKLKVKATTRNWKTVQELARMAGE